MTIQASMHFAETDIFGILDSMDRRRVIARFISQYGFHPDNEECASCHRSRWDHNLGMRSANCVFDRTYHEWIVMPEDDLIYTPTYPPHASPVAICGAMYGNASFRTYCQLEKGHDGVHIHQGLQHVRTWT